MFEKKIELCIFYRPNQLTLFFLYFHYPHELESGSTYNKE